VGALYSTLTSASNERIAYYMFSVVVPVYNHARHLEAAVRSALQSSLVAEVLLVDDGSNDGSAEVIERLARVFAPRVRNLTVSAEPNLGAHQRLNQLCQSAKSDWLAILNSDDEFTAGRFEILRMVIRATRSQFVCGGLLIIDGQNRVIGTKRGITEPEYELPQGLHTLDPLSTLDIRRLLCNQNFVATTSNMVIQKNLYHQIGGFADFRYVHDWDFALRATMFARCAYTPNLVTKYRVHRGNTISETSSHIDGEVVRMFARFLEEFPEVERDPACRHSLTGNRHLGRYVPPERLGRQMQTHIRRLPLIGVPEHAVAGLPQITLPGCMLLLDVSAATEPWDLVAYLHAPLGPLRLPQRAIDGAVLCLAHFEYDFIVITEALDELPTVRVTSLRDAAFFNEKAACLFMLGETPEEPLTGRVVRLQPAANDSGREFDIRSFPGFADARLNGAEILLGGVLQAPMTPMPVAEANIAIVPHSPRSDKPRVMVLPIFLAIGGAERNMVEVIRALRDSYDFLVVTTERLAKHQGSLHFQLDDLGIQTLDLAEIGDRSCHVILLETISRAYPSDVVWICNGSPWLADNSEEVRRIFSHTPIVDQQVYDTDHGWINRYTDRGIQSFDRFIAINQRIREKFLGQIGIPSQRVDLIYHAINSKELREAGLDGALSDTVRLEYGIPKDSRCFGFLGRLTNQKRPLDYLALAREARDRGLDDHFLLVGNGELLADCDSFLAEHGLPNVTCIRLYDAVSRIVSIIDGLIITSAYEGLPIVLLETLSLGKPVLATDVGDIKLVLEEYGSGKVVPAIGDLDALWSAFAEWRADLAQFRSLAEDHAEAVLERFSSEMVAKQYHRSWLAAMNEYAVARARIGGSQSVDTDPVGSAQVNRWAAA
jgi:glycosyltransferase involved in cell wall biosynthesis